MLSFVLIILKFLFMWIWGAKIYVNMAVNSKLLKISSSDFIICTSYINPMLCYYMLGKIKKVNYFNNL